MWWCVVVHAHARAPHQIYASQDCTTPTRFCRICHTLQSRMSLQPKHIEKLTAQRVLHGKSGPKTPVTTLTFFFFRKKSSRQVVLWQLPRDFIYELWCQNNQSKPNLTCNLGTTYHATYNIHTYHHLFWKELLAWKVVWHLPQDGILM